MCSIVLGHAFIDLMFVFTSKINKNCKNILKIIEFCVAFWALFLTFGWFNRRLTGGGVLFLLHPLASGDVLEKSPAGIIFETFQIIFCLDTLI